MEKVLFKDFNLSKEEALFKVEDKSIIASISDVGSLLSFNIFDMSSKRVFSKEKFINRLSDILNYFEEFYDTRHRMLYLYRDMKIIIDCITDADNIYTADEFKSDLNSYFEKNRNSVSNKININIDEMVEFNIEHLKENENYELIKQYHKVSILFNLMIPLITHYMSVKRKECSYEENNKFLYSIFVQYVPEQIIDDINNSINTIIDNSHSSKKTNEKIESKNINKEELKQSLLENVIINIIPKMYFEDINIMYFKQEAIRRSLQFKLYTDDILLKSVEKIEDKK